MTIQQPLFAESWRWKGLVGTSSARFSEDRRYRYELRRTWSPALRPLIVIACNPSIATDTRDDPTCRRLYAFADRWGLGGVYLLNAFALCSTDPKALKAAVKLGVDPVGPDNDATIRSVLERHREDKLLLAWGGNAKLNDRGRDVGAMALSIHGRPECFGLTEDGHPVHPLYQPDVSIPHLYASLITERAQRRSA